MKPLTFAVAATAALAVLLVRARPTLAQDGIIRPYTKGAYETLDMLKKAVVADRMNSHAWTSDNPTLDAFYAAKARQVQRLIDRLEGRQMISSLEVERALDNRGALRLSGEYWNAPDVPAHY